MSQRTEHNQKVVEQHTQQAEGYARLTGCMATQRWGRHMAIGTQPDDTLLDIACGTGSLTLELAPHVAEATGLDLTPAMLEQARCAQEGSGATNVSWVEGDAANLPFADGSFSLVTCSAAFHHFERPAAILAEMARVCRKGGRLVVSDVAPADDKAAAYDRMEKLRDPSHGHAHPAPELEAMGEALGLGTPRTHTSIAGPMPYQAVLATSFPEQHSREELLALMREDAASGADAWGFHAQLIDGEVFVSYPMSMVIWTKP